MSSHLFSAALVYNSSTEFDLRWVFLLLCYFNQPIRNCLDQDKPIREKDLFQNRLWVHWPWTSQKSRGIFKVDLFVMLDMYIMDWTIELIQNHLINFIHSLMLRSLWHAQTLNITYAWPIQSCIDTYIFVPFTKN